LGNKKRTKKSQLKPVTLTKQTAILLAQFQNRQKIALA
jgi:hypothetical protein